MYGMASIRSGIGENMEDRYLFKAKRLDNGEWVEWDAIAGIPENVSILADTICQCTGLKDKNGKLIWENDIVRTIYDGIEHIYQVIWDKSELDFKATNGKEFYKSNFEYLPCCEEVEVIGNIFDNPELLESEEK